MAKALCIIALAISTLLLLVFLLDFIAGIPFGRASLLADVGFLIACGGIGAWSFLSLREQR